MLQIRLHLNKKQTNKQMNKSANNLNKINILCMTRIYLLPIKTIFPGRKKMIVTIIIIILVKKKK